MIQWSVFWISVCQNSNVVIGMSIIGVEVASILVNGNAITCFSLFSISKFVI